MTLIERIQKLCEEHGTTLIGLERTLGFGRGTIRKWESSSPSIDKLGSIADYFNTSTDYLRGVEKPIDDEILGFARSFKLLEPSDKEQAKSFLKFLHEQSRNNK